MRSLLVALDDTPAGAAAIKLALSLATRHGATLTGLGVLDIDYLTAPEPRQIRTAYYNFKADLIRLKEAHERGEQVSKALSLMGHPAGPRPASTGWTFLV